jgi:hypothetical protein
MELNLTSNVDRQAKPYGEDGGTAAARYGQLQTNRDPYLQRARVAIQAAYVELGCIDAAILRTVWDILGSPAVGSKIKCGWRSN